MKQAIFGEKAPFVPPLYLMEDPRDYAEFKQNGLDAFSRFLALGLRPTDRILDIGCGGGRKTIPLLDYLTTGSYEGFDPVAKQVRWCTKRIVPRYPNFRFRQVDIWSGYFNPSGKIKPSEYRFPFNDGEFDFVIVGSVFTHMFPSDVKHYIQEISPVLKPHGRGWVTFFLLNHESLHLIARGTSTLNLVYEIEEGSRTDNPNRIETAVAHQEERVLGLFRQGGIRPEISEYGSWCGRPAHYYQDVIKITKTSDDLPPTSTIHGTIAAGAGR